MSTTEQPYAVSLTDLAAAKVAELAEKENMLPVLLRFSVEGGGCGGLQYGLGFIESDQLEPEDSQFTFGEVTVVVDQFSLPYVRGASIDFRDDLQESGFKIDNPNASDSCGCGHSFTADGVDPDGETGSGCGASCGC